MGRSIDASNPLEKSLEQKRRFQDGRSNLDASIMSANTEKKKQQIRRIGKTSTGKWKMN